MKLRNIFTLLAAVLTFSLVGCQEEERFLDEVKVSSSYVTIPVAGGQTEITVTAADAWEITGVPEWLTVTPVSGNAGETKVTFKAGETASNNEVLLSLNCAGATQYITVHQVLKVEKVSPISEVLAAQAGSFRIRGEVYGIYNTQYGNFYMKDETGSILIYGCLDAKGAEKNFSSLGIDNGDVITCEGPLTIYNGTYELVNVTVLNIEKSLLKLEEVVYGEVAEGEEAPAEIALEGGSAQVILTTKTFGVNVEIADDAKSWLSVGGVSIDGTTATVTLNAAASKLGDRKTTVTFTTEEGGKTYTAVADIAQKGAILEKTAAEINAAADGETIYRLTGYISEDTGSEYGNIYITDHSGTVYVYGVLNEAGESKKWLEMGIKAGDIVTVEGVKTSYKESPQMKNVTVTKHIAVTPVTVAEFLATPESKEVYYQLSGTVKSIAKADYGNLTIEDETGEVYVYGVLKGWGGPSKQFESLGVKEGDKLTIVGYRASYNGSVQVGGGFYVSHEAAGEGGETPDQPGDLKGITYELVSSAYDDGLATVNGVENTPTIKIGTSSKAGTFTLTIPAGTKKVSFYAVAWKGLKDVTVDITPEGGEKVSLPINANDGATGQAPYTITATDADKYSFETNNAADLKVTVTSAKRVIFWGITAE